MNVKVALEQAPLGDAQLGGRLARDQTASAMDETGLEEGPGTEPAASLLVGNQVEHHIAGSGCPDRSSVDSAQMAAAMPPFMSALPRPYNRPASTRGSKGSWLQASLATGTTSRCPLMIRVGRSPGPAG